MTEKNLTVADFFCGAGGFSEGFRMAGAKVVFALDNWKPARKTHELNHPDCMHPDDGNITNINQNEIDEKIPDTDIIVGSPPCVTFSSSNKAGKADKKSGIELIEKYLQIIAIKKNKPKSRLKYWLMENVPNSRYYIKEKYTFKDLGIDGKTLSKYKIKKKPNDIALKVDTSTEKIYNSVHFGVPQKRVRFITGEFPEPEKRTIEEEKWISLGKILNSYRKENEKINDPLFRFKIPKNEITDHFYNTEIHPFDWKQAMIKKTQARYYGKMSFPENEKSPARTIMATRSTVSREAMIFSNGKPNTYRAPTIREVASIMSFPIIYLFYGEVENTKYKLVGNAVCPKMSFYFAKSIIEELGKETKNKFYQKRKIPLDFKKLHKNPQKIKKPKPKKEDSNYAEIVPNLKYKNFRVELDNNYPKKNNGKINWRMSIHHATGKDNMKSTYPSFIEIKKILENHNEKNKINQLVKKTKKNFEQKIPESEKIFQKQFCTPNPDKKYLTPRKTLLKTKKIVDEIFPEEKYKEVMIKNENENKEKILDFGNKETPNNEIPIRHIAAGYVLSHITTKLIKR